MTTYEFKYRIQSSSEPTQDGSGSVMFDMYSVQRPSGTTDPFTPVPGYHQTAPVSASNLKVVNDMPHSTAPQKAAKNTAAKNLLKASLDNPVHVPVPIDWNEVNMQAYADANDVSALESERLNTYVTVTLGQSFPLDLTL